MGGTIVECEEHTCAFQVGDRCIAKHVSMVLVMDENLGLNNLTCDTYEHRDSWIPEPEEDPFEDENYACDTFTGEIL